MAYLAPSEFVPKLIEAGESKIMMSTKDTKADEDFDDAHSDQAARMAPLAKAIADDVSRPSDLRANMAFNYASYLATRFGNRREAYRYYKLSCDLVPKPSCQAVLADFKDTP